ncbi:hypothetical protein [Sphingomonas sp.]|jgi:hypothetical protein|uniref:hypothetical protein n=1 Tax=Sphingomonas sp. TaxID=28214 RepID=UPI002ED794E2
MHDRTNFTLLPQTASLAMPAEAMYAALSPRAPAFVRAPSFTFTPAHQEPSRLELLRRQIVAAQQMRRTAKNWH